MSGVRWSDEHSARTAPVGLVIYDDDDDLFTVKAKSGEWVTYGRDRYDSLTDRDIDGDRGDQIVGEIQLPSGFGVTARRKQP